jgi:hypothetical protein
MRLLSFGLARFSRILKQNALPLVLGMLFSIAQGAEDESVLLTLDGSLIGPLQSIDNKVADSQKASELINTYHELLTIDVQEEVKTLHEQILRLIPDFEVAYAAADSAEIAHVMSEIDIRLAAIQEVHGAMYTQDLIDILTEAYYTILPTFGDEQ